MNHFLWLLDVYKRQPLNRAIYTEDGDMQDIYAGDFLVVGLTEDDFGSLTSEDVYKRQALLSGSSAPDLSSQRFP